MALIGGVGAGGGALFLANVRRISLSLSPSTPSAGRPVTPTVPSRLIYQLTVDGSDVVPPGPRRVGLVSSQDSAVDAASTLASPWIPTRDGGGRERRRTHRRAFLTIVASRRRSCRANASHSIWGGGQIFCRRTSRENLWATRPVGRRGTESD